MRKTAYMTVAAALALAFVGTLATATKRNEVASVSAQKIATSVAAAGFDGGLVLHPQYDPMLNAQHDGMVLDGIGG